MNRIVCRSRRQKVNKGVNTGPLRQGWWPVPPAILRPAWALAFFGFGSGFGFGASPSASSTALFIVPASIRNLILNLPPPSPIRRSLRVLSYIKRCEGSGGGSPVHLALFTSPSEDDPDVQHIKLGAQRSCTTPPWTTTAYPTCLPTSAPPDQYLRHRITHRQSRRKNRMAHFQSSCILPTKGYRMMATSRS